MTPEQKAAILEILDGAADMTIATMREDGYPQATTVSFAHDGLAILFGCGADSQKARNIRRSEKVSITVNLPYEDWTQIRGLSLAGRARILTDPAEIEGLYRAMLAKFPQVADYAELEAEAEMVAVRIDPVVVSLLDYRKGFGHTEEIIV